MATFVMIHGAFSGGWSWDPLRQPLLDAGHQLLTPDLPSQGDDKTPYADITLDAYVERVLQTIESQNEKVILCGHSLGGISISQTAERCTDKIEKLVYIAAFMLTDGDSPKLFWENAGEASPVMAHSTMSDDGIISFDKNYIAELIYNCSPQQAIDLAVEKQIPMARKPLGTPLQLSDERYGSIPRVYIACQQDKVIPWHLQQKMIDASPCEQVITLDTDHIPMASKTDELVKALLNLAEST